MCPDTAPDCVPGDYAVGSNYKTSSECEPEAWVNRYKYVGRGVQYKEMTFKESRFVLVRHTYDAPPWGVRVREPNEIKKLP